MKKENIMQVFQIVELEDRLEMGAWMGGNGGNGGDACCNNNGCNCPGNNTGGNGGNGGDGGVVVK